MTRELEQMKQPYRLGDDGTTILVDRSAVPQTRLRLMGKDLPLHGAVGLMWTGERWDERWRVDAPRD